MNKFKSLILSIMLVASGVVLAQPPKPADKPTVPVLIKGGTIHVGNGQVFKGDILIATNGKIEAIYKDGSGAPTGLKEVNAVGKHVYPGFIGLSTTLGLQEAEAIRATRDFYEVGNLNPNVRALIAYNCESEVIPTVRYNGILTAQIEPQGGLVAGKSSVMNLDCWNWEDGVVKADEGLHINWPSSARVSNSPDDKDGPRRALERQKALEAIKQVLVEAKAYQASTPQVPNLKLEAMAGLYDSTLTCYIHAETRGQIVEAVQTLRQAGVKRLVVASISEAVHDAKAILKQFNIPVILNKVHRLPQYQDQDVDLPYRLPGILMKDGLTVALGYEGEHWQVRNLPFQAGTTAAYGLSKEEALMLITSNAAKILGVDKELGTLEAGKRATLFISEGDALDMRSSRLVAAFIDGRAIGLESRQTRLYEKYAKKLGQEPKY